MNRLALALLLVSAMAASAAPVKSGRASAELIAAAEGYRPGHPLWVGVRIVPDDGWHTYWTNPGEGGMKPSVDWKLPDGWQAGDLQFPAPGRFMTGDLPGFGYEREVVFPVRLTPPPTATGEVELRAGISWLTCDESACVPGEAPLTLRLKPGDPATRPGPVARALECVPRPLAGALLEVAPDLDRPGSLLLTLRWPAGSKTDVSKLEVFPVTENVIDDAAKIRFRKNARSWMAVVPKSEYATRPLRELSLVLSGDLARPVLLRWTAP